jgi:hypothetical protein
LFVVAAGAVVVAAGASVAVALGGDRAPAPPRQTASIAKAANPAPKPAQCATWGCTPAQHLNLGGGYTLTLWHAGKPGDERSEPVLELSRSGVAVQWWLSPHGNGWSGTVQCKIDAPEPNCVLTDGTGAHSAMAQMLVLRSGRLVAMEQAYVVADLPTVVARDLDGDGYLDVAAVMSDYTPNFAQSHLFWDTYLYADGQFRSSGCAPRNSPTEPAPAHPLDGTCPIR